MQDPPDHVDGSTAYWIDVSHALGISVEAPFELVLKSGLAISASACIRYFGARHGMLIFSTYDVIRPHQNEVISMGFGYSVIEPPKSDSEIDLDSLIDMLRDWSWTGPKNLEPEWLGS